MELNPISVLIITEMSVMTIGSFINPKLSRLGARMVLGTLAGNTLYDN